MDKNNQLKTEIDNLCDEISLFDILDKFGKVYKVGSYTYDLMAWRDFDLVLNIEKYTKDEVEKLVNKLRVKLEHKELKIEDNFEGINEKRPTGVWIGLYIKGWKIDLWVMNKENASKELMKNQDLALKLKDIDKDELVNLKSKLVNDPGYHKRFSSVDLYNAYVDDGVRTESEFYEFIKEKVISSES